MDEMVLSSINSKIPSENSSAREKQLEREGDAIRAPPSSCLSVVLRSGRPFRSGRVVGRLFGPLSASMMQGTGSEGRRGRVKHGETFVN